MCSYSTDTFLVFARVNHCMSFLSFLDCFSGLLFRLSLSLYIFTLSSPSRVLLSFDSPCLVFPFSSSFVFNVVSFASFLLRFFPLHFLLCPTSQRVTPFSPPSHPPAGHSHRVRPGLTGRGRRTHLGADRAGSRSEAVVDERFSHRGDHWRRKESGPGRLER